MNNQTTIPSRRSHALDALRGYAIMTMILSATEAFQVLPSWMYHAQVPPPDHVFTPSIYGITWVDLIFPFFLFSMGAAVPLSLGRQYAKGVGRWQLVWKCVQRWLKLSFFAIFIMHAFPFMLGYQPDWLRYVVPMLAFGLLCLMFMPNPFHLSSRGEKVVKGLAYAAAIALMLWQPYANGGSFHLSDSDIIMLILANVALTGSLIYLLTIHHPWHRIAIMPFIMGLFMASHTEGSWASWLMSSSVLPWLYQVPYQEYLLVIIPGTIAGDWLSRWLRETTRVQGKVSPSYALRPSKVWLIGMLSLLLIVSNVVLLFCREMVANLVISLLLVGAMGWLLKKAQGDATYWNKLWQGGSYLLLLGLFLEAYEGGIRKDDVTLSYLFVTSGLAFFALLFFTVVCDHFHVRWISTPLELVGKNPMVAYVASSMVVIPLLVLCQVYPLIESMSNTPLLGFLKGVLLTALCMMFTAWFTKKKYFWKT